jgi:hypothetical protein
MFVPMARSAIAAFFADDPGGLAIFGRIDRAVRDAGGAEIRVSRSQIAFRRSRTFAIVWWPGRYVRSDVPAVLSLALPERVDDPRFKQVVHPSARTWMHHLELRTPDEVDAQVRSWLVRALEAATDDTRGEDDR